MENLLYRFKNIVVVDFEYIATNGERPIPVCLVAHELITGRTIRQWQDEFGSVPPYDIGPDTLFVSYQAAAELSCHLVLGWHKPEYVLDLYVEYRNLRCGNTPKRRKGEKGVFGLLPALFAFGLQGVTKAEKSAGRDLVMRGGPWAAEERKAVLDYCETDVVATKKLLYNMIELIDLPQATLRGRSQWANASMEHVGIPVDTELLAVMTGPKWREIQGELVAKIDAEYGVFTDGVFKTEKFIEYLIRHDIPWPQLDTGSWDMTDDTFDKRSKDFPELTNLRYLRNILKVFRKIRFHIGKDGFNRAFLNPFAAKTSRYLPSAAEFVLYAATWIRGLIKPPEGYALAVLDYANQEFAIAAYNSGDQNMIAAYESGDPYWWFAEMAGAVPSEVVKDSEEGSKIRDMYKVCVLSSQYFIEAESLSRQIKQPVSKARQLLRFHRETFHQYWSWIENAKDDGFEKTYVRSVFGWTMQITDENCNPRTVANFFSQANGAEMLRLACVFGVEDRIRICGPLHDAVVIIAPVDRIEADTTVMIGHMERAAEWVTGGFKVRVDADIIKYPNRYSKKKGRKMWETVTELLGV